MLRGTDKPDLYLPSSSLQTEAATVAGDSAIHNDPSRLLFAPPYPPTGTLKTPRARGNGRVSMQSVQRHFGKYMKRTADEGQVSVLLKDFDDADQLLTRVRSRHFMAVQVANVVGAGPRLQC